MPSLSNRTSETSAKNRSGERPSGERDIYLTTRRNRGISLPEEVFARRFGYKNTFVTNELIREPASRRTLRAMASKSDKTK